MPYLAFCLEGGMLVNIGLLLIPIKTIIHSTLSLLCFNFLFITDHVTHFISHTTLYRALNIKQQRFSYFPIILCTFYWVYINVTVQPRFHAAGARAQTKSLLNDSYHNIWSGQQYNSYNQDGKTKILSCVTCFYSQCLAKMKNERRA